MVRSTRVAGDGRNGQYGPDLVDRWKGRAFQQNPDSDISLVGFEDEQTNWEANSALLGERAGPVRAIREVWGADSGTNVTKTEYYYRDYYVFRYHLRVHPIPPDGIYTSWDHNVNAVTRYYDEGMTRTGRTDPRDGLPGVAIDGQNDDVGNLDTQLPFDPRDSDGTFSTYFDVTDPTFAEPLAFYNWEEVSGPNGSLVYMFQLNDAKDVTEPLVEPYYRDDACFDDGTGDDPSPRVDPGNSIQQTRPCYGDPAQYGSDYSLAGPWRQGCFACHGIHYMFTSDTDNATAPKPVTEIDGQQYVWAVPTNSAQNVGDEYANTVKIPLGAQITSQDSAPPNTTTLENTGAIGGEIGDPVSLSARLTDQDGRPVPGERVAFSISGMPDASGTTNESGVATVDVTLNEPARDARLVETFAGDDNYGGSKNTIDPFIITRDTTALSLSLTKTAGGVRATAALVDEDTREPVSGKAVTFSVEGSPFGQPQTTDQSGNASVVIPRSHIKKGQVVSAAFAGNDTWGPSQAQQKYTG
jgi:hypothetical protein